MLIHFQFEQQVISLQTTSVVAGGIKALLHGRRQLFVLVLAVRVGAVEWRFVLLSGAAALPVLNVWGYVHGRAGLAAGSSTVSALVSDQGQRERILVRR